MNKNYFFLIGGFNTMNRNKKKMLSFSVTEQEYNKLIAEKPSWENVSHYIRRKIFNQ